MVSSLMEQSVVQLPQLVHLVNYLLKLVVKTIDIGSVPTNWDSQLNILLLEQHPQLVLKFKHHQVEMPQQIKKCILMWWLK